MKNYIFYSINIFKDDSFERPTAARGRASRGRGRGRGSASNTPRVNEDEFEEVPVPTPVSARGGRGRVRRGVGRPASKFQKLTETEQEDEMLFGFVKASDVVFIAIFYKSRLEARKIHLRRMLIWKKVKSHIWNQSVSTQSTILHFVTLSKTQVNLGFKRFNMNCGVWTRNKSAMLVRSMSWKARLRNILI